MNFNHPVWFFCSLVLLVTLRFMRKGTWDARKCLTDLSGKTTIVTGANTGLGKAIAMDFARRNGRVILACRSRERGQAAVDEIQKVTSNRNVILEILDTSSMASVRDFAKRVLQSEKRLDILVNNAGASGLPRSVTSEGLEVTLATNHLGPFLLTNLLLDLMKRSGTGRIVFLSSFMHAAGFIDTNHLYGKNMEKLAFNKTYNCSKLWSMICAKELAKRLQGTGVTVNSVSPGVVLTEAIRNHRFFLRSIFNILGYFFFKTADEGAASTIYCAVSEEAESFQGKYIDSNCNIIQPSKKTSDPDLNKKVWEACEAATDLTANPEK
ncbi:retinol dehydrogenase 12-like isoform X2 [Hyperolius riggenbachi]|uniref:retinol dehydrogenase 12-like isoform X2 n=1 Tax=Hyperolius riggenbachi TaxID=752182 RepID=UPI0035A3A65A